MTKTHDKAEHIVEGANGVGQWHIKLAASTSTLKILPQSITAVGVCDPGTATLSQGNRATYSPYVYIRIVKQLFPESSNSRTRFLHNCTRIGKILRTALGILQGFLEAE